jgi:hypothetical protein
MQYKSFRVLSRLHSEQTKTLLLMLEDTINAAALQQTRIEERFQKGIAPGTPEFMGLYADSHFYLICWDNCRKILSEFVERLGHDWLKQLYAKYKDTLDSYNKARNTLEHAEERVFELGDQGRSFQGWFEDNLYHIQGLASRNPLVVMPVQVSIGTDSLQLLQGIFNELLDVLDRNLIRFCQDAIS